MLTEEGLEGLEKCPCGHSWIADHVVTGDQAHCQHCSCILERWDLTGTVRELKPEDLTPERRQILSRFIKEPGK